MYLLSSRLGPRERQNAGTAPSSRLEAAPLVFLVVSGRDPASTPPRRRYGLSPPSLELGRRRRGSTKDDAAPARLAELQGPAAPEMRVHRDLLPLLHVRVQDAHGVVDRTIGGGRDVRGCGLCRR